MNEYKVVLQGTDIFGITFLQNVVKFANMGGTICSDHPVQNKFPHSCVMLVKTKEKIETDMKAGVKVLPVFIKYTKEQLEEMSWEDFKKVVKKQFNIGGRDRQVMTTQYLQAVEESEKNK
jgi:hypothetical protein